MEHLLGRRRTEAEEAEQAEEVEEAEQAGEAEQADHPSNRPLCNLWTSGR